MVLDIDDKNINYKAAFAVTTSPLMTFSCPRSMFKFEKYITNPKHLVIKRTHPSPLGANQGGWFNMNTFNQCNEFLRKNNIAPIEWVK